MHPAIMIAINLRSPTTGWLMLGTIVGLTTLWNIMYFGFDMCVRRSVHVSC